MTAAEAREGGRRSKMQSPCKEGDEVMTDNEIIKLIAEKAAVGVDV